MSNLLFVYGSLMHNFESLMATYLKENADFLGWATTKGKLYDLGQYPGFVYLPDSTSEVKGNLFQLYKPKQSLTILDAYEGIDHKHPIQGEYCRKIIEVVKDEKVIEAWAYIFNGSLEGKERIKTASYLEYAKSNPVHLKFIKSV